MSERKSKNKSRKKNITSIVGKPAGKEMGTARYISNSSEKVRGKYNRERKY